MNITMNFTQNNSFTNLAANQPVAVMPTELAKKLLKLYANQLVNGSNKSIINTHIEELQAFAHAHDLQGAMETSISWLTERELILNITNENWDAYKVEGVMTVNEILADQL